jgi:hypothetical protein
MEGIAKTTFSWERRRYKRFEFSQALACNWSMIKGTLRTVDLSLGGVKIRTDNPIPVGERLDLIILLEYEAIRSAGKVVRSNPLSNGKYDVGILFETISHQCLKRLERFLHGNTLKDEQAKGEKSLKQSGPRGLESKVFELGGLKANFLTWLQKSYPGDYQRYTHQPKISENEIRDFLKSKGIDQVNIYYLMKCLRGGSLYC